MTSVLTFAQPATGRRVNLFDYISPTRLNTWLTCPLKFKIRYVEGIKEPTSPSLFFGKRIHDALAFLYGHRQNGHHVVGADVSQHIVETWDEAAVDEAMCFESHDAENALKRQAVGLIRVYLDQLDSDKGVPIAVESPLECPLIDPSTGEDLGIALFGFVDLVLEDTSGPAIIDFKSSARSRAPLEITHEVQLSCYAYAFRQVFNQTEHELQIRSLIKTKTPKVEIHRYPARDDSHFRRLFAVIHAYLDNLHSGRFVYRPGWMCSVCDYRESHCHQWQR